MNYLRFIPPALVILLASCTRNDVQENNIIPVPVEIIYGEGAYDYTKGLFADSADSVLIPAVSLFNGLPYADSGVFEANVHVCIDTMVRPEGAYRLAVNENGVLIKGGDYEGVVNGIATLRQFMWDNPEKLPFVEINDSPRFAWRGVMLDVARHFFTVREVESLIDEMAVYKLNRLHLHLTDDQGWRIEIKSFPKLTEVGAWRTLNNQDSLCIMMAERDKDTKFLLPEDRIRPDGMYGGYYTQEQMLGIIKYAAGRGIEIIPEIDFPGHSLSVLRAYPELSCDGKGGTWGKNFSTPLCLGNDRTLEFCHKVLDEIFTVFPSAYVHVGGDEVERTAWEQCPKCRERVISCSLGDTENLQPWFTRELENYCVMHGHRMIGWDEVARDNLSSETAVMWWRNWSPATLTGSLASGHDVIVCPSEYYYFWDEQDANSLGSVYNYEPSPAPLDGFSGRVIGVQGNLWTEKAPTIERAGERMFPRLLAITETAWTMPGKKDFDDFRRRLPIHYRKLNEAGWKYRLPDVKGIFDRNVVVGETIVNLDVPDGAKLYYTLDGTVPDTLSALYTVPFVIKDSCTVKYRCYNSRGIPGELCSALFFKTCFLPAMNGTSGLSSGLLARWYDYQGGICSEIDKSPLKDSFICDDIYIPEDVTGNIGLVFDGYADIPSDGIYQFYTYTDDGSVLKIDGRTVVDNDGAHSRMEKTGQIALRKGLHKFSLRYFDSNGGILEAGMTDPQGRHIPFPKSFFKH